MPTPTILIFERSPRWVPELERQFVGREVRVRGCRTLSDVRSRLDTLRNGVVIFDLDAAPAECLQTLGQFMTRTPSPAILVVASQDYRELEWRIRELGATTFLEEPIPGNEMAAYCQRQLDFHETAT